MTSHSPQNSRSLDQGISAALPKTPSLHPLTEQQLSRSCDELSQACYRAHQILVAALKLAGTPREVTERLSPEIAATIPGVFALSDDDRKGLLQQAYESLRTSGALGFGGAIDYIEHARKFEELSPASVPLHQSQDKLAERAAGIVDLTNSIAERLTISLSTTQNTECKQLCVVILSGLIQATKATLPQVSREIRDALSQVLITGAETPVWAYDRASR